jgi:cell division protein FtsW (lipid II flippase)
MTDATRQERRIALGLAVRLLAVFAAVAAGYATILAVKVSNAPSLTAAHLAPLALYALALAVTWGALAASRYRGDTGLVAGAFLLAGIGLVTQLRMGAYAAGWTELVPLALGAGVFVLAAVLAGKGRAARLVGAGWPAYLGALAVMALVVVFGRRFRGGLYLPGLYNPTEFAKPLLVLFLAAFLDRRRAAFGAVRFHVLPAPPFRSLAALALVWLPPMALSLLLGDLGLVMMLSLVLVAMLYAVERRPAWLLAGALALVALGALGAYLSAHANVRVAIWRNPFADPTGRGWQVLQALAAMYAGGMWGCGLGSGTPAAVPIVSSDFVYAALGEEIGLAGCALLLTLYGVYCGRAWRAAANAAPPAASLLGAGLAACLASQMLLNVAGVTKALPLTGLALPFISHGGSSFVTSFLIAGLLVAISESGEARKGDRA